MDSKNQFFVFCISVVAGFLGGLLYEPFACLRLLLQCEKGKRKAVSVALDICFLLLYAGFYIATAYLFHFPSFRVYMWIGYAGGGIIYSKILRRILDFCQKVCYNGSTKLLSRAKSRKKLRNREDKKT